ncbi:hypothetical protein RUM44_012238 [Polyplax serrata]|uniref:Uncharacterized protein n=1 Tax=Polyplax serrata TaxID=468196 RepID=A0ABR1BEY6_POLSC
MVSGVGRKVAISFKPIINHRRRRGEKIGRRGKCRRNSVSSVEDADTSTPGDCRKPNKKLAIGKNGKVNESWGKTEEGKEGVVEDHLVLQWAQYSPPLIATIYKSLQGNEENGQIPEEKKGVVEEEEEKEALVEWYLSS